MIGEKLQKIISGTLLVVMLTSCFWFIQPKEAEAQFAVVDAGNIVQTTISAINSTVSSFSEYSVEFKEYVLDGIATMLAKQIIRQLTADVVNWINSGFEGSPAFVTNPGSFFLDVADQMTGDFLAKNGGPLTDLCSPFSIDIRIALAFKYHPNIHQKYACTIGTIIKNSKNAIQGASINGFTAGDFRQGGWPAFVSLTTEPQNNVYGSYLEADSELSIRVANAQLQQKDELNQGKGFLSWKKCTNTGVESTAERSNQGSGEGNYTGPERSFEGSGESFAPEKKCEIQTPGSVIVSSLEANVNGPLHELELADELNEIVNALFAQLATQILKKGLGSVSGSSASDSSSYIYQIQQEAKVDTTQVGPLKTQFLQNIETYIKNTTLYKDNKNQSLNTMLDVKSSYEAVKSCYQGKIDSSIPPLDQVQIGQAEEKIAETDSKLSTDVSPIAAALLAKAQEADARYTALNDLKTQATAAQTVNDLNTPSQKYGQMLQDRSLVSAKDISDSQQELSDTQQKAAVLKQDAQRRLQECQIFPAGSI